MRKGLDIDDLGKAGIVLSTPSFIITRESIQFRDNTKLRLSDIAFVEIQDNKRKVNTIRWILIVVICAVVFAYELLTQGYLDEAELVLTLLLVAGLIYLATAGSRKTELLVYTNSGHKHVLAEVDHAEISYEDVYKWCGIISATGVDWKT